MLIYVADCSNYTLGDLFVSQVAGPEIFNCFIEHIDCLREVGVPVRKEGEGAGEVVKDREGTVRSSLNTNLVP